MPRSIWTGVITFGLVSIPVKLYTATQNKDISFHLLHTPDHTRIQFKRWCPTDEREVEQDEIVRAFEVSKDQYIELTEDDLEQLPLPSKHTIELSAFVSANEIDPIYYEKAYYLEPDETGLKPYALLTRILQEKGVTGVAKIALRNKEQLCALRPSGDTLVLETLYYPDEIREHEFELPDVLVNKRELAIAGSLVDALSEPFNPGQYHDTYRQALLELVKRKTEGREVVVPEGEQPKGEVTDLMSALRASIEAARKKRPGVEGAAAANQKAAPAHARAPGRTGKSKASSGSKVPAKRRKAGAA